jgi:hypothetical protein
VLDDGCDDRRRAESGTYAGEPVVCFDADQRRITLDLGSEVGAVTFFLWNGCRHRNRGHFDDFHRSFFPGQSILSRFELRSRSIGLRARFRDGAVAPRSATMFPRKGNSMRGEELTAEFGIAGVLDFVETEHGLVKAAISARRRDGGALPARSAGDRVAAVGRAAGPVHQPQ